jgi:MFS family permease
MSWNPFDPMAEAPFKPVAGGYLYQAPSPWLLVRGQRFRVTEAQKAELVIRHRTMLRAVFWLVIIGGALGGALAAAALHDHGWKMLAICGLVGLVMGYPARLWLVLKVRPMLGQLAPTDERITGWDRFKRQAVVFPPRFVMAFGLLSLALTALEVARGISGPEGWDSIAVFGTALFGLCTIYWAVLYVMHRMSRSPVSNDQ